MVPGGPVSVVGKHGRDRGQQMQPKTNFESVDDYIASQPEAVQGMLERVRNSIRKAVPRAEEKISYNMPGYKLHGSPVLGFAAWRQHYALYGSTREVVAEFTAELAPYQVDKGTIRFRFTEPVPVNLIGRIAKFRAKQITERDKAKAAARKKR